MKRSVLPRSLDPRLLPEAVPRMRHWFRYPLHRDDFHALRSDDRRLLGYYSAKPLYGRLDRHGRVDRSQGFNGQIAGVFVPAPARSWKHADLFFTEMEPAAVARLDGKRNWPAINAAAERELHARLGIDSRDQ